MMLNKILFHSPFSYLSQWSKFNQSPQTWDWVHILYNLLSWISVHKQSPDWVSLCPDRALTIMCQAVDYLTLKNFDELGIYLSPTEMRCHTMLRFLWNPCMCILDNGQNLSSSCNHRIGYIYCLFFSAEFPFIDKALSLPLPEDSLKIRARQWTAVLQWILANLVFTQVLPTWQFVAQGCFFNVGLSGCIHLSKNSL